MRKPQLVSETTSRRGLSAADAVAAQRQLTSRDFALLDLLATHRVLTSTQIARLLFASENVARKRLAKLHARAIVARFRTNPGPGSVPWRYTLGPLGAMITAAQHGHTLPAAHKTHARALRLSRSPHLEHLLGVNDVFSRLAAHARTAPGCELVRWWNEHDTAARCADIVHPDGYGEWHAHGRTVGFFLEYDNGTEPLSTVAAKLDGYRDLAAAGRNHPVLFVFAGATRHTRFHQHLTTHPHLTAGLTVATAITTDLDTHSPAGPVWLPATSPIRRRLIDLDAPPPATRLDTAA
ncbi:replication-relaxation family protein [Nocardia wallacei]|uniref:replication-relaxation family protein n=1 Tax=Nocardia wallacei TaxID=480035 RepID=UPI0024553A0B|nr:replication-relaxation family protein [Nocardia wallacei]